VKANIPTGASGIFSSVAESIFAAGVGLLAGGVLLALLGKDPVRTYFYLFQGSFGDVTSFTFTLAYAAPLILTALTFAVGVRAGLFNIGAEGTLYVGGAAAVAASLVKLPFGLGLLFVIAAAGAAGAAWSMPAYLLKSYRGVNEVISTIMMNNIALFAMQFVVLNYLLESLHGGLRSDISASIPSDARFPVLISPFLTYAIFFACLVCFAVYYYLWQTPGGYELRAVGLNPDASKFSGISPRRPMLYAFLIGGVTAGVAGAVEVAGIPPTFAIYTGLSNLLSFGFNGIGVALIGRNHPLAIILAGVFYGALQEGAASVQIAGVSNEIVQVVEGIIVFAIAAPQLYHIVRSRVK
jgi:simple sugar transport system permease protein